MKKIVFYSFFDNYRRCQYVDIWRKNNPEQAKSVIFFEALPGRRHPQAKTLGMLFLHSGDKRSVREYESYYEALGIPALNVRTLSETPKTNSVVECSPKPRKVHPGIEIIEISPTIRNGKGRKAKG